MLQLLVCCTTPRLPTHSFCHLRNCLDSSMECRTVSLTMSWLLAWMKLHTLKPPELCNVWFRVELSNALVGRNPVPPASNRHSCELVTTVRKQSMEASPKKDLNLSLNEAMAVPNEDPLKVVDCCGEFKVDQIMTKLFSLHSNRREKSGHLSYLSVL